jgi:hypothetical protein
MVGVHARVEWRGGNERMQHDGDMCHVAAQQIVGELRPVVFRLASFSLFRIQCATS